MSFGLFHYKDRNHDGVDDELAGRPDGKFGDIGDFNSICKHSFHLELTGDFKNCQNLTKMSLDFDITVA